MPQDRAPHWDAVYSRKSDTDLSWHQDEPTISLELADLAGLTENSAVIDIGGGTSRLAEALTTRRVRQVSVLDVSRNALVRARARMGAAGERVNWIVADITAWQPDRRYDLWHDRAVFHFLTEAADRRAYMDCLSRALSPGGHAIIATFALEGPQKCSGLPVVRYSPETLLAELPAGFTLTAQRRSQHRTPGGKLQSFQYSLFRNKG